MMLTIINSEAVGSFTCDTYEQENASLRYTHTSRATDCFAQDFFTWSYIIVLLMPRPQKITKA